MTNPNEDYYAWALSTAQRARKGLLTPEELAQVAEELESMGASERRELRNRLSVVLAHLLKWQYQAKERSYSWEGTISGQRDDLQELLEDNPSLKPEIPEYIEKAYQRGIKKAVEDTNLAKETFPATFADTGWTWEQVLDPEFYPD